VGAPVWRKKGRPQSDAPTKLRHYPGLNLLLLTILSLVIARFTVDEELDTADGDGADEEHVNVTALVHDKLQDKPKDH
jgi:hypothetical protein